MNMSILVIKSKRTLRYEVKYIRDSKNGSLSRTIECDSPEEAAAAAIDVNRRLFHGVNKIVAPPEVSKYL